MTTGIICVALVIIAVIAIKGYTKRLSSGCCGSAGEASIKKVKVKDRSLAHYPYRRVLWAVAKVKQA